MVATVTVTAVETAVAAAVDSLGNSNREYFLDLDQSHGSSSCAGDIGLL